MLLTKTAINASRAMRNDFISFQIKSSAAMSFWFYNSQGRPTSNNHTFLQTKREISRAYQSSQKIFRVRRPFVNPPWVDLEILHPRRCTTRLIWHCWKRKIELAPTDKTVFDEILDRQIVVDCLNAMPDPYASPYAYVRTRGGPTLSDGYVPPAS